MFYTTLHSIPLDSHFLLFLEWMRVLEGPHTPHIHWTFFLP